MLYNQGPVNLVNVLYLCLGASASFFNYYITLLVGIKTEWKVSDIFVEKEKWRENIALVDGFTMKTEGT
jgi:hypothetical protein